MKSVLTSIQPKWCELIAQGKKTIEVRKTRPKIETPFKCYIYCTKPKGKKLGKDLVQEDFLGTFHHDGKTDLVMTRNECGMVNGKVIGEFVCDYIEVLFSGFCNPVDYMTDCLPRILANTALRKDEFAKYVAYRQPDHDIYGWHISNLKIYDKPREIAEFYRPCPNPEAFCESCKYVGHNPFDGEIECRAFVKRPPQSWMYVEEGA